MASFILGLTTGGICGGLTGGVIGFGVGIVLAAFAVGSSDSTAMKKWRNHNPDCSSDNINVYSKITCLGCDKVLYENNETRHYKKARGENITIHHLD